MHVSKTHRRSFLSGRLPIHHGEQLSGVATDDLDLRQTWVSEKLTSAGYDSYWFGKGHTGYESMNHLPMNKGFKSHMGFLGGSQSYTSNDRWEMGHPVHNDSQFVNPPSQCGGSSSSCTSNKDTILPCGDALEFKNATSAEQCCSDCQSLKTCTHWVYDPTDPQHPPCHLKSGASSCPTAHPGAASGVLVSSCATEYATTLYGDLAIDTVRNHDPNTPLFLYIPMQAVHTPYDPVPGGPYNDTYTDMFWASDVIVGQLVDALKANNMWDNTLFVYSADNGGVDDGINYPERGEKHTNWQGGMRVCAFVSGGFVPASLRGTSSNVTMHIADWYATFAVLAGVDPSDNPSTPPLPVDPSDPHKNIYGNDSFPPSDAVDVWPYITNPAAPSNAAHDSLVLSREVILQDKWKLVVAQPLFKTQNNGWRQPNGTWIDAPDSEWPCNYQDQPPSVDPRPYNPHGVCLFDIDSDPNEHVNVAGANPTVVESLYSALNTSILTFRDCSGWMGPIKGPDGKCSPASLLGKCDQDCANNYWEKQWGSAKDDAPYCDVPACN